MVIDDLAREKLTDSIYNRRFNARLKKNQSLRLMVPRPEKMNVRGWLTTVFKPSHEFSSEDRRLLRLMTMWYDVSEGEVAHQELWDAVAVAGRLASSRGRRRAVVLVVSHGAEDRSDFTPNLVRHYLAALHVPLVVWSPDYRRSWKVPWGPVVPIASHDQFNRAAHKLTKTLDRQAVVWLEGLHLPHRLRLSPQASGFSLLDAFPDTGESSDDEPAHRIEAAMPAESIFGDVPPMSSEELEHIRSLLASIPGGCARPCVQAQRLFDVLGWAPDESDIRYLAYVNDENEFEISQGVALGTRPSIRQSDRKFCVVVFSERNFGFEARLTPVFRSALGRRPSTRSGEKSRPVRGDTATQLHPLGNVDAKDQLWIGAATFDKPESLPVAIEIDAVSLSPTISRTPF
jgi:hypothetical protein